MNFLEKLQKLPLGKRKIILWTVMVVVGIVLAFFFIRIVKNSVRIFGTEEFKKGFNTQKFQEEIKKLPQIEMPEILKNQEESNTKSSESTGSQSTSSEQQE